MIITIIVGATCFVAGFFLAVAMAIVTGLAAAAGREPPGKGE
jgi:hypothetical protein